METISDKDGSGGQRERNAEGVTERRERERAKKKRRLRGGDKRERERERERERYIEARESYPHLDYSAHQIAVMGEVFSLPSRFHTYVRASCPRDPKSFQ